MYHFPGGSFCDIAKLHLNKSNWEVNLLHFARDSLPITCEMLISRRHSWKVAVAVQSVYLWRRGARGRERGSVSPLEMKDELWKCTCFYAAEDVSCSPFWAHAEWETNQISNWLWGGGLCSPETRAAVLPIMHYLSLDLSPRLQPPEMDLFHLNNSLSILLLSSLTPSNLFRLGTWLVFFVMFFPLFPALMCLEVIEKKNHWNVSRNYASRQSPSTLLAEAVTQVIRCKLEESSSTNWRHLLSFSISRP